MRVGIDRLIFGNAIDERTAVRFDQKGGGFEFYVLFVLSFYIRSARLDEANDHACARHRMIADRRLGCG